MEFCTNEAFCDALPLEPDFGVRGLVTAFSFGDLSPNSGGTSPAARRRRPVAALQGVPVQVGGGEDAATRRRVGATFWLLRDPSDFGRAPTDNLSKRSRAREFPYVFACSNPAIVPGRKGAFFAVPKSVRMDPTHPGVRRMADPQDALGSTTVCCGGRLLRVRNRVTPNLPGVSGQTRSSL